MPENSIDAIVTDPPYGLEFMGAEWDCLDGTTSWGMMNNGGLTPAPRYGKDNKSMQEWHYRWAVEALRVAKPGAHMLAFGGDRTHHRLMVAIEDAGWEIRTCLYWAYSQGFPKSLDVSKAIDKAAGAEREVTRPGQTKAPELAGKFDQAGSVERERRDAPATDAAKQWNGWGTALKPAVEIITMARKPLSEKTVAKNLLKWGTGAINIDACRIGNDMISVHNAPNGTFAGGEQNRGSDTNSYRTHQGRYPATLIHDGSDEVVGLFPETGAATTRYPNGENLFTGMFHSNTTKDTIIRGHSDNGGSAARFFYTAKPSPAERGKHLLGRNKHPTVKPVDLLRYLCRLITPPNGTILDPFCGSGSTGVAAFEEGFNYILIDKDPEFCTTAKIRCAGKRLEEFC